MSFKDTVLVAVATGILGIILGISAGSLLPRQLCPESVETLTTMNEEAR